MTDPDLSSQDERRGLRRRLLGGSDRLGWWTLPLFAAVGLAGAVLATALLVVAQDQRIQALRDETADARADLAEAVEQVEQAAGDALEAIEAEVDAVRDTLATDLPLDDAAEVGVVHLTARLEIVELDADGSAAQAPPDVADDGPDDASEGEPDDGSQADPDGGSEAEAEAPAPTPAPTTRTETRRTTGFVVAVDGEATYVATTLALLADPTRDGAPQDETVEVRLDGGQTSGRLHSWDGEADLLVLRVGVRGLEPLPWRAEDRPLGAGDRVVAVGLTPQLAPVRVGGTVAATFRSALVTDVPPLTLLEGGPVVDADGQVVGLVSPGLAALGGDPAAVPIRRLCDELLAACPE